MILSRGRILENKYQMDEISKVYSYAKETIENEAISMEIVVEACDRLAKRAIAHEFDSVALPLLEFASISYDTYLNYCRMFLKEQILKKIEVELNAMDSIELVSDNLYQKRVPLGILLHIAAGNVDVLPAYSVVEGLLAGNINILKLPSGDSGLSIKLLYELIKEEPRLKNFIYVFDVPSIEIETIKKLAHIADAVVIWGGDEAIKAAHQFVEPNTRLICWGHKISFAYANVDTSDELLYTLALDICSSNQLYCSSCQGIYLNTNDMEEAKTFSNRFFELLKKANKKLGKTAIGYRGRNKLYLYNDKLEKRDYILDDEGVSVSLKNDNRLELSYMFRNVWIKLLKSNEIISTLKDNKGYLQSCALLINSEEERDQLINIFSRAGITRITYGNMQEMKLGEAHDGRYALAEYSKIVNIYK